MVERGMDRVKERGAVSDGGRVQVVEFNHDVYRLPTLNAMFGSHFHVYNEDRLRRVSKGDGAGMVLRKRALNGRKKGKGKKAVTQPVMQLELWDNE
jgi:hypothetical protein